MSGHFPMPGTSLHGMTVVASVWLDSCEEPRATVIRLADKPPFFRVTIVSVDEHHTISYDNKHRNIVPCVRDYEQNGGDY